MSRLRRLKERKRKQFIKTIMSSLALALVMSASQGVTTYAWFTDEEIIDNDLFITMGDLDVEIGDGFNITDADINEEITNIFTINNKGSLNQKVKLNFELIETDIPKELLDEISYTLELKSKDQNLTSVKGNMGTLLENKNKIEVKDEKGNPFILQPGENLECVAKIKINNIEENQSLNGKILEFNLNVIANQTNLEDKGFMDTESQYNKISIKEQDLGPGEVEGAWGRCKCCNLPGLIFDYPEDLKGKEVYVNLPFELEDDSFSAHYNYNTGKIVLIKRDQINYPIKEEDVIDKEFIVDFNIPKDKPGYDRYSLFFEKNSSGNLIGKWTFKEYIEEYSGANDLINKPEIIEPPKEEVKVPSETKDEDISEEIEVPIESEVVELPKEEVEVPSEPEIVEPPKEEVEVPSQPDTIAPPKEEIEIQE